ncbi:MAG TPA: hypothetical protein PLW60_02945 [Bacilli bacterium]|nr:MAG: hypothetical protein BWY97_01284 [Tenericutes bacterium ADurb.BinA124]HNZ50446.1 hypothetical protein [Bacilli bacterium]HPX84415.1 hypothetical protein [Bacilli bacterium]HQC74472.1 hypothetical protein [Bacilli bacterium]
MNKVVTKKFQANYKTIVFWSLVALLTLAFIVFVVVKFVESSKRANSLDELTNLSSQQIFEKQGTYYVYAYSRVGVTVDKLELEKSDALEETIITYLTFAKRHASANRMYGMNVDSYENNSCLIDGAGVYTNVMNKTSFAGLRIHKGDVPILMKITDGKVAGAYLTESDIREELQTAMNS